jgi:hypothetical protein
LSQVTFRRDVGKKMGDVGEFGIFRAETALQVDVSFVLRHCERACEIPLISSFSRRRWKVGRKEGS